MATKRKNNKKSIKNTAKNVNNFVLDTAEMLVDESFDRTAAWQEVTKKAIAGGFKLAKTQSDLTFKALETFKRQWLKGQTRFNESLSK